MFTTNDIETRTVFVINCIDKKRNLRVSTGELLLEETNEKQKRKTLTKFPFQKVLCLLIIGDITVTTPLIDKCKKFNVGLIVLKANLRPVFYWSNAAEANFLLRQKQYAYAKDNLTIARWLVHNKICNQFTALKKTRKKDFLTRDAMEHCLDAITAIDNIHEYNSLMGLEGTISKLFFKAYFQDAGWQCRRPRTKCDCLNVTLDIGYTLLFNFIECFTRMFGFDLYVGVYHRLWFKRKSLICDLMEPFRCLIDHATLLAFHRKQFSEEDFELNKEEYYLKREKTGAYYKVFCDVLIDHKIEIFRFIQSYYRCFMGNKDIVHFPTFTF